MTYYLQVNQDNIITDAVSYPVDGYVSYQTNQPLPIGVYGGWWKLENGALVEYPELKPKDEVAQLKTEVEATQEALDFLLLNI